MRLIHVLPAVLAAAGFAIASSADAQTSSGSESCNLAAASGVAAQQLSSGNRPRGYRLFVPPGYDGRTPLPLVLDLHGSGGSSEGQAGTSRFEALAEREGFLVATLDADEGRRWNVPVTDDRADDVQYVSDVIDQIGRASCRGRGEAAEDCGGLAENAAKVSVGGGARQIM